MLTRESRRVWWWQDAGLEERLLAAKTPLGMTDFLFGCAGWLCGDWWRAESAKAAASRRSPKVVVRVMTDRGVW